MSPGRRLRLLGGRRRGLGLEVAAGVRPSPARLREALASRWAARLPGCRFLDLFAGSGAVGLEAASRGAREVVLVEESPRVFQVLERNLARLDDPGVAPRRGRLPAELPRAAGREPFDLVFADPPYGFDAEAALLEACVPLLRPGAELALEHAARDPAPPAPPGLELVWRRRYGDSALAVYRRTGVEADG